MSTEKLEKPNWLRFLSKGLDYKILILGLGREGMDTFSFLRKLFPEKRLGLADQLTFRNLPKKVQRVVKTDNNIVRHFGRGYLSAIKNYQIIIKSPGIPPKTLKPFVKKGVKITKQTEIFFEKCPGVIIGITGTKGKSTTSALIYRILKQGGLKVHLVGNIGKAVLSLLFSATRRDIYVYELSSHQLLNLKKSPHIAVLLGIYPEHLDYYRNLKEYVSAKTNITRHQNQKDYLIYNSENRIAAAVARKSKAQKIPVGQTRPRQVFAFFRQCTRGLPDNGIIFQNSAPGIILGKLLGIPDRKICLALKKFKPLAHRLEYVGTYRGIKFYNDSLSTIPEASMLAMNTLGSGVKTMILGGFDRKYDFGNLAKKILKNKIRTVILFPATGYRIWQEILKQPKKTGALPRHFFTSSMAEAVRLAYRHTTKNEICLLSCASPSFGIFKNYKERGNLFKKYVRLTASIP